MENRVSTSLQNTLRSEKILFSPDGTFEWRKPDSASVSILFAGDISVSHSFFASLNGDIRNVFGEAVLSFFDNADLRIAQWEMALTDSAHPTQKAGPSLKGPPEAWKLAKELNINVSLLANNHIGDFGSEAVLETIRILHEHEIATVGAGINRSQAAAPLRLQIKDFAISILNAAEHEFGMATDNEAGAAELTAARMVTAIVAERNSSDIVIVAIHGGNEYRSHPSPRQQELHRAFIDAGADMVFNCHAHQIQGIEVWRGKPIVYCPGNFLFPRTGEPANGYDWWNGFISRVSFDNHGPFSIQLLPIISSCGLVQAQPTGAKREFFENLVHISEVLRNPRELEEIFQTYCKTAKMENRWIQSLRNGIGSPLLPRTKRHILSFLCRVGVLPASRLNQWKLVHQEVLFCESHLDVARQLLQQY